MKTYLFDTINRYKRFSENLDVSATLCNRSWWVFNDEGVKSLYIFQPNGDLYITTNGVGLKGSWQYISANKTVIINSDNKVMMFHPVFVDDNILTLTLDGTQYCAFLIDENNRANFAPKSLYDLTRYFQAKEQEYNKEKQREEDARRRAYEGQNSYSSSRMKQNHDACSSNTDWSFIRRILVGLIIFFSAYQALISLSHHFDWREGTTSFLIYLTFFAMVTIGAYIESNRKG